MMDYYRALVVHGAVMKNIKNWAAHWLYGTPIKDLVAASKRGIVYNPPGH